ncbi:TRAP transporter substrate-binding protein DctP [Psychromarinibacter halotolerans]|uniref:TRAP transporter substrate-binding protein DctP n=1 Tax=Psychromarinibacter halotolerans TaxID=1775175 RepID=UPI0023D7BAA8|nr:TRAP transporter substrate-binding protein DctP [Psychromarinibacter halotolerans]MDF0596297.1 TRAP transporter substrate-binding protein DctP [Psychromarinibacter halotolerans]
MSTGLASAQEVTLSAVTTISPGHALAASFVEFVEDVNANGEGVLQIDIRGGVEVIPRNEQYGAVSSGVVDMFIGAAGYYHGVLPELAVIDAASAPADVMRAEGVIDALDEVMQEKTNVKLLAPFGTGYAFQFYTIDAPTITDDGDVDMSGMRVRGGPSYAAMYDALGLTRIDIPVQDIYTSLERGVIDGVGYTTLGVADSGWQDFIGYRIFPTWRQGNTILAMNAEVFNGLTEEQSTYLMDMVLKHEMLAYDLAQSLEEEDTAAMREAGVEDIMLEGPGAETILGAFANTFWEAVEADAGAEVVERFKPLIDAANEAAAAAEAEG